MKGHYKKKKNYRHILADGSISRDLRGRDSGGAMYL
jgi:hypothetical protein